MKKAAILLIASTIILCSCSKKIEKIDSLSQLNDKRICVLTGSAGDHAARKAFPEAKFLDQVGSVDAALAVKTKKADAFVYDKSVLDKIVANNPELKILDEPVSALELAAAFRKDNLALVSRVNGALAELRNNGELERLKKKWIETTYSVVPPMPAAKTSGKNGTLKMGTCAIYEPYTFLSEGCFAGYDIELSTLIGDLLDMKIEIVDMTFESLIPALQGGKIDFALSNFTVTEERKKYISYSEPYLKNDISALVRAE